MDWHSIRPIYLNILTREGFRPELDGDGDIHFKYEGGHYYVTDNCDDTYFQVLYPNFWTVDSGAELGMVMVAASAANRKTKAAKIWVSEDLKRLSAATECLIASPSEVQVILARSLRCLRAALDNFKEEMRKQLT